MTQDEMRELWSQLDNAPGTVNQALAIEDADGNNVAGAQMRLVRDGLWLYVDDVDGYDLVETQAIHWLLRYARPV